MKILLDECVTRKFKPHLTEFEVKTVVEMNWSGLKNGRLMSAAIDKMFDILLTIDENIGHQQNMSNYKIVVVVLVSKKAKLNFYSNFCRNSSNELAHTKKARSI